MPSMTTFCEEQPAVEEHGGIHIAVTNVNGEPDADPESDTKNLSDAEVLKILAAGPFLIPSKHTLIVSWQSTSCSSMWRQIPAVSPQSCTCLQSTSGESRSALHTCLGFQPRCSIRHSKQRRRHVV